MQVRSSFISRILHGKVAQFQVNAVGLDSESGIFRMAEIPCAQSEQPAVVMLPGSLSLNCWWDW